MKAVFAFIFKNKYYKNVISMYKKVMDSYEKAYNIWAEYHSFSDVGNFESKEIIARAFNEIESVQHWMRTYHSLAVSEKDGLRWFMYKTGMSKSAVFKYKGYKVIEENVPNIFFLQCRWNQYIGLINSYIEAVHRFLPSYLDNYSYENIDKIVDNEQEIRRIASILSQAHNVVRDYKQAWKLFSKGRRFDNIPVSELKEIRQEDFSVKEQFISLYKGNENKIKLIFGNVILPIDSFDTEAIEQEQRIINILSSSSNNIAITEYSADIHLEDKDELKRAIMDSLSYGKRCRFNDNFTISDFYDYRQSFDEIHVAFDDAVDKIKSNENAVKAYNKEHSGKSVVYIENYLAASTPDTPLYKYIENYTKQQTVRNEARQIADTYPLGFKALFDDTIDFETCSLFTIDKIISLKLTIRNRQNEEEERARRQREQEQRQLEQMRRKAEIERLKGCVSSWNILFGDFHYNYLFPYYPTTCDFDATDKEWDNRYLVWNFKNTPGKTSYRSHEAALDNLIPRIIRVLTQTFGTNLSKLTLVCIPAATQDGNNARFEDFSDILTEKTGMDNSFSHIRIVSDATPKHLGGTGMPELSFDQSYFKGRYILLFDDVITKGNSMYRFKNQLEEFGATVIAGFSIGKTTHTRI